LHVAACALLGWGPCLPCPPNACRALPCCLPHRRAYERHFKEFRHQNGMRALGIPNNKNFFEVRIPCHLWYKRMLEKPLAQRYVW